MRMIAISVLTCGLIAAASCTTTGQFVEIPCREYSFSHKPDFHCLEHYKLDNGGNSTRIEVSCTNAEWFVEIALNGKSYPKLKYSDYSGAGGGGIWKLYQSDVNADGQPDFVAAIYNGGFCGKNADLNNVVFFVPKGDSIQLLNHWTHSFSASRIPEYYMNAQQDESTELHVPRKP